MVITKYKRKEKKVNPYLKREYSEVKQIQKQKQNINNKFSELLLLSESLGKILVVDSIKENSRNTLKKFGFNESDIISVDSYGEKHANHA